MEQVNFRKLPEFTRSDLFRLAEIVSLLLALAACNTLSEEHPYSCIDSFGNSIKSGEENNGYPCLWSITDQGKTYSNFAAPEDMKMYVITQGAEREWGWGNLDPDTFTVNQPTLAELGVESCIQSPVDTTYITTSFSNFHPGLDLGVPVQTPIQHIFCNGQVVDTGYGASRQGFRTNTTPECGGHTVTIRSGKTETEYLHMSGASPLQIGDTVTQSTIIGYTGGTAGTADSCTTGTHLHFEIGAMGDGLFLDPQRVLSGGYNDE